MRTITNNNKEHSITVDPNLPDFSKSPFALKKAEKARAFIAKNGLPKSKPKKTK
jgi:hypothetical protein